MPLDENAKAANVVGSVQQYVKDQLSDVLNSSRSAIDYGGGLPFRDDDLEQWVQVRLMGPTHPNYIGLAGGRSTWEGPFAPGGGRGRELFWLINLNCFVRPAKSTAFTNLQIWRLRDAVSEAFLIGVVIPVKDYQGSGETIGNMFVYDVIADRMVSDPQREELVQHNLVYTLRWTETWNNPDEE